MNNSHFIYCWQNIRKSACMIIVVGGDTSPRYDKTMALLASSTCNV